MLKRDPNYKRLKLGATSSLSNASYWVGPNHLLVVEVTNYVERYRRFYFRDIQAILVQKSLVRLGWNLGFGVVAGLLLIGLLPAAFSSSRDDVAVAIWFGLFLLFSVCMIINTLRGPTCLVQVRTAVQNQKLSGLRRWRKADALIAAITPFINAAQSSPATATENPPQAPATGAPTQVDDPDAPPQVVS